MGIKKKNPREPPLPLLAYSHLRISFKHLFRNFFLGSNVKHFQHNLNSLQHNEYSEICVHIKVLPLIILCNILPAGPHLYNGIHNDIVVRTKQYNA